MNRTFPLILVLFVIFAAVGFYRGWFVFNTVREPLTNKVDINLTIDQEKMKSDARSAKDTVKREADDLTHKVNP